MLGRLGGDDGDGDRRCFLHYLVTDPSGYPNLAADAVDLRGLDHAPRDGVAGRPPSDQGRKLGVDLHALLTAYGAVASLYLASPISAVAWAALPYTSFKAEYLVNEDGTYSLNPACANDVLMVDTSNVVTGVVSKAQGVLAPQLVRSWSVKNESCRIFELD